MIKRRKARENAFFLIFGGEFAGDEKTSLYDTMIENSDGSEEDLGIVDDEYTKAVYFGVIDNIDEIDGYIARNSKAWKVSRLSGVSRAAMRLAVYEMLYREDVPNVVSINEAIELVKRYDADGARSFVNGVLNAISGEIEKAKADA